MKPPGSFVALKYNILACICCMLGNVTCKYIARINVLIKWQKGKSGRGHNPCVQTFTDSFVPLF